MKISEKVKIVFMLPELQNAWESINKVIVCHKKDSTAYNKGVEILELIDDLKECIDENKFPLTNK